MDFQSSRERELFVQKHLGIVWYMARQLTAMYQPYMELSEAVGDGMVGLVEAVAHYKPELNPNFFAFAKIYIRGEIVRRYKQFHSIPLDPAPGQPKGPTAVSQFNATRAVNVDENPAAYSLCAIDQPDRVVLRRETARLVERSLKVLSSNEAEVIKLLYYGGLARSEVADNLGVSIQTVHNRHRSAQTKLMEELSRLGAVESSETNNGRLVLPRERTRNDRNVIIDYIQSRGSVIDDPNGNVLRTLSSTTGIPFKRARALIRGLHNAGIVRQTSKMGRGVGGMYKLELIGGLDQEQT